MRVRVIEDDEDVSFFLNAYLEHSGVEVETTSDNFALLLQEDCWEGIDAALVDLNLKGRLQGVDMLRWLRDHEPQVRRVVLSGNVDTIGPSELEGLAHAVIRKPPDPRSLLAALRRHDPSG